MMHGCQCSVTKNSRVYLTTPKSTSCEIRGRSMAEVDVSAVNVPKAEMTQSTQRAPPDTEFKLHSSIALNERTFCTDTIDTDNR